MKPTFVLNSLSTAPSFSFCTYVLELLLAVVVAVNLCSCTLFSALIHHFYTGTFPKMVEDVLVGARQGLLWLSRILSVLVSAAVSQAAKPHSRII